MFKFGERAKTLVLLLSLQVACVVTGLWVHYRFVITGARHAELSQGWHDLDITVDAILSDLSQVADWAAESQELDQWLADRAPQTPEAGWLVVDPRQRVLRGSDQVGPGSPLRWLPADHIRTVGSSFAGRPVLLRTPQGERAAVALPLAGGSGFLIAHTRQTTPVTEALSSSLTLAGVASFVWICSLMGIATCLVVAQVFDRFRQQHSQAEAASLQHSESMARMRDAVIFGLAKLTESRDPETGFHLERIALFSSKLAQALRRKPKFRDKITREFVNLIESSSILHDIGKVGVEDAVLLKPGPLDPEERERMQQHAVIGGKCIEDIERRLGSSNFLQMAREIAYSHHERWDGTGYPEGLAGEQIPLAARIVSIVDVYEALSSRRIYKEPLPHDECLAFLEEQSGKHFDPDIVEVFLEIHAFFRDTARRFAARETADAQQAAHALDAARAAHSKSAQVETDSESQPVESPHEPAAVG